MRLFFVLVMVLSATACAQELPYRHLLFIDIDDCLLCNQTIVNSTIENLRSSRKGKIIGVLSANSLDDYKIYCKNLRVDSCIYDTIGLFKKFNIKDPPVLLVTSQSGYELYRCESIKRYNSCISELLDKTSEKNFNDIPHISLERNESSVLGNAYQPVIDFRDNTLYTVDILQNEIAGYNIFSGKRVLTILPPSKAEELSAMKKSLPEVFGLDDWGISFANPKEKTVTAKLEQVSPTMVRGKLSVLLEIETRVIDSTVQSNGSVSRSSHFLPRLIHTTFQNNQYQRVNTPASDEYAASYVKYREPIIYSNLSYGFIKKGNKLPEDSISAFFISRSPTLEEGRFFLNYGRLKKEYGLTRFNTRTTGILEYNHKQKGFVYMNHWNHIFCKVLLKDTIIKFKFTGLLHCAVPENPEPRLLASSDSMQYFVNDILSNSRHFFVLIQPYSPQKSSSYYILQRYDWNGKLVRETPVHCNDDKVLRINLAGCTEEHLYVLVKLAKKGYILQKLSSSE